MKIGWGQKGWVGMVKQGGDRWKGLCTEEVILYEGGWWRKWTWNMGAGETIIKARKEGTICMGTIFWGREPVVDVSQWEW